MCNVTRPEFVMNYSISIAFQDMPTQRQRETSRDSSQKCRATTIVTPERLAKRKASDKVGGLDGGVPMSDV